MEFQISFTKRVFFIVILVGMVSMLVFLALTQTGGVVRTVGSKITNTKNDIYNKIFDINLKTPFILSRDFARVVDSGDIINIIDTKITKNDFQYAAYTLSKKILADFTLMTANEFAPNIRVNGIAPGLILPPVDKTEQYLDNIAKKIPLKRKGDISDITNVLEFLLNLN